MNIISFIQIFILEIISVAVN